MRPPAPSSGPRLGQRATTNPGLGRPYHHQETEAVRHEERHCRCQHPPPGPLHLSAQHPPLQQPREARQGDSTSRKRQHAFAHPASGPTPVSPPLTAPPTAQPPRPPPPTSP